MPRAADAVARLDDAVVVDPGLVEADGDPDAGETGADDQDFVLGCVRGYLTMVRALRCRADLIADVAAAAGA